MPRPRPEDVPHFPRFVHVENTNACPARCIMCPMDSMTRKTGIMGTDLFQRLVRQCARHGGVEQLHLHGFGEPLADKAVAAKVAFAKDQGIPYTYMVTTANSLSEKLAEDLVTAGLDGIKFSFYGMTAETYERNHRRLSFHRTVANIETFFRVRDELGASGPEVRFQFSRDLAPAGEFEQFIRHWRPLMDRDRGDRFVVTGLHNWAGGKNYAELRLPEAERHCNWPFRDMQILWDGRVVPCVFDYDGSMVLGDATGTALHDIWHSPAYERLREVWRTRRSSSVPLCAQCDDPEGVFHPVKVDKPLQPRRRGAVPGMNSRTGLGRLLHFRR